MFESTFARNFLKDFKAKIKLSFGFIFRFNFRWTLYFQVCHNLSKNKNMILAMSIFKVLKKKKKKKKKTFYRFIE